jgi:hypothetical protein
VNHIHKKRSRPPGWDQVPAVLVALAVLATAVRLELRGEALVAVLTATLAVSTALARRR